MSNLELVPVGFIDVTNKRKSKVWKYFLLNKAEEKGKCKICNYILKNNGSSTGVFINHLKAKHGITIKRCMSGGDGVYEINPKQPRLEGGATSAGANFGKKVTLGQTIAHLVSVDGFTYRQIATSLILKRSLRNEGYDMPDSPQTVRDIFLKEYHKTMSAVKDEIAEEKSAGKRFSISLNESTTPTDRRYVNITLHRERSSHSLGLIHIEGSLRSEQLVELVEARLEKFNISLYNDITATTTNETSTLMKFGCSTAPIHVMCVAHTLDLSACDVLYKKGDSSDREDVFDSDDVEHVPLRSEYADIVEKIQEIELLLQNNNNLQPLDISSSDKELQPDLEYRPRWSNLLCMLRRFHNQRSEIRTAMYQLEKKFPFSDKELQSISELCKALEPFNVVFKYIRKEGSNLWHADKVVMYAMNKLLDYDTNVSRELSTALRRRMKERRNPTLYHLVNYLRRPSYMYRYVDSFGERVDLDEIRSLAVSLLKRLHKQDDINPTVSVEAEQPALDNVENDVSNSSTYGEDSLTKYEKEFELFLESTKDKTPFDPPSLSLVVELEMSLFEDYSRSRPRNLDLLFHSLMTIQPTSVEGERTFSSMELFTTRFRTRLSDECLDALVFMRQHCKKIAAEVSA